MEWPRPLIFVFLALLIGCNGQLQTQKTETEPKPIPKVEMRTHTGAAPNDVILIENISSPLLVVAASMDSAVQFFELPTMTLKGKVFFPPNVEAISPNPWALASTSDGSFVAVSLFDDHRVALIDVNSRRIVTTTGVPKEVTARHPTALKFIGNDLYVAFTNLMGFADFSGEPSKYGPGVLARFSLNSGTLSYLDAVTLPCKNPSDLVVDGAGHLAVSCAGSQFFDAHKNLQLYDGAAIVLLDGLRIVSTVALTGFSPSKIISNEDGVFLTSNLKRQVLFVPSNGTPVTIPLNEASPDEPGYVSAMLNRDNNCALIADFRTDQIFELDLKTRTIKPEIKLQSTDALIINKGPLAMAMSKTGELFVLMGMSAEILSVKLEQM